MSETSWGLDSCNIKKWNKDPPKTRILKRCLLSERKLRRWGWQGLPIGIERSQETLSVSAWMPGLGRDKSVLWKFIIKILPTGGLGTWIYTISLVMNISITQEINIKGDPGKRILLGHLKKENSRNSIWHRQNKTWKSPTKDVLKIKNFKSTYIWISSNEVDETGANYTEWSKPERKTPIQYTNTYIWNLERW